VWEYEFSGVILTKNLYNNPHTLLHIHFVLYTVFLYYHADLGGKLGVVKIAITSTFEDSVIQISIRSLIFFVAINQQSYTSITASAANFRNILSSASYL